MGQSESAARDELLSLLREKRAVLMVGAGSSRFVGYPSWDELVSKLNELAPGLRRSPNTDRAAFVEDIKQQLRRERRLDDYYNLLERTFSPRDSAPTHAPLHCALVQLGFAGIVTTNYDPVLEWAIGEAFSRDVHHVCRPIDLCQKRCYRVFDFLRSLSRGSRHDFVLHLHGWHENPTNIILTRDDYQIRYGERRPATSSEPVPRILDTIHRKVIWSLMAMHSVVFVGFSMDDDFFMDMVDIVQQDFRLGSDPVHFAIIGYTTDEEKGKMAHHLRRRGIAPVFYQMLDLADDGPSSRHRLFEDLILNLARSLDVTVPLGGLDAATRKMLER